MDKKCASIHPMDEFEIFHFISECRENWGWLQATLWLHFSPERKKMGAHLDFLVGKMFIFDYECSSNIDILFTTNITKMIREQPIGKGEVRRKDEEVEGLAHEEK